MLTGEDPSELAGVKGREADRGVCAFGATVPYILCPGFRNRRAYLRDVSRRGMGLVCPKPLPLGTRLAVLAPALQKDLRRVLAARVVHVTLYQKCQWLVGCALADALTEDEMRACWQERTFAARRPGEPSTGGRSPFLFP
jgi:PilZ domain